MKDLTRKGAVERDLHATLNWRIIGIYLALVIFGWMNVYAASHASDNGSLLEWSSRSGKQFVWILTSLGIAATLLFVIKPRTWEVLSAMSYILVLVMLGAVIFMGVEVNGSRSWFALGPVRFQPAEVSKITTSLLLATIMSRQTFRINRLKDFLIVSAILLVPMVVILLENETGSMLVYIGFIFVLYREGLSGWIIAFMGLCVILFIMALTCPIWICLVVLTILVVVFYLISVNGIRRKSILRRNYRIMALIVLFAGIGLIYGANFAFNNVLQDHQRKRIEVLLGMTEDPNGVGYNVRQSMIAIGSGGFAGKGYLNGTQTTYGFVPEQSTDFIFCTVGEEWGFLGCLAVILTYAGLIFCIIKDSERSRENFTRIYGYCLASCLFMHLTINIGMTIGLMPVIGIPLPLLSYGGSSLWSFTTMIFIFLALDREEKKYFR